DSTAGQRSQRRGKRKSWVKTRCNCRNFEPPVSIGAGTLVIPRIFTKLAPRYKPDLGPGSRACSELHAEQCDLCAWKSGASAFFPGKCDLHEQLKPREIDTLLITGAVTNIGCESSARDATELDYKVIMVSDALSGHAHGLHEATLSTFYRIFGDVRPSSEIIELLSA